MGWDSSVSD